jgi:dynein heavy chain
LKPLGSWSAETIRRIEFFNVWMRYGNQSSFWLSAFYFPQSVLTGILQRHSRLQGIPIDALLFELEGLDDEPRWNADKGNR